MFFTTNKAMLSTARLATVLRRPFSNRFSKTKLWAPRGDGKAPEVVTAQEAVRAIQSNNHIYVTGPATTPSDLLAALCDHVEQANLTGIKPCHLLLAGKIPWMDEKFYGKVRSNCLFIDSTSRKAVNLGHADYIPVFLSDYGRLFEKGIIPVDVAMVSVSPPDELGYCTLGVDLHCTPSPLSMAKIIMAEINPKVPRTSGDSLIHISNIDYLVQSDRKPYGIPDGQLPEDVELQIGKIIAENLVEDGATMQLGIGGVPDSTLRACENHKDLGIHTELASDGIIGLLEKGVITNKKKTVMPGKVVTSFAVGTQKFYQTIDKNPAFHFAHCAFTNNTEVIRENTKMTCINSALEVDITGQVVSDSIGQTLYSGFGGQVDFITAAGCTKDGKGKAIIALSSRTNKGLPKIVPVLKEGAGVVTTRGHVHYIVTEFGIAELFGRNVRQRARSLIDIAHPDDREKLEKDAFNRLKCMPSL